MVRLSIHYMIRLSIHGRFPPGLKRPGNLRAHVVPFERCRDSGDEIASTKGGRAVFMSLLGRINLKNAIIAGAFVVLGAVAAVGWSRKSPESSTAPYSYNNGTTPQPVAQMPQPVAQTPANNLPDAANTPVTEQRDSYGRPIVSTVTTSKTCVDPNSPAYQSWSYPPVEYAPVGQDEYYAAHYIHSVNRPIVVRTQTMQRDYVVSDDQPRVYVDGSSDRMIERGRIV